MEMIDNEQDKHDDRELRRINNMKQQNQDQYDSDNDQQTEESKQQSPASNTATTGTRTPFVNTTQVQPHLDPVDINAIAENAENVKHFEDDDEHVIRNRIKRCITKAQRG